MWPSLRIVCLAIFRLQLDQLARLSITAYPALRAKNELFKTYMVGRGVERIVGAQGRSHNLVESICRGMWATVLELTSLDGLCVSVVCLQILDTATRYAIDKPRPAVLVQVRFRQRSMAISEGFPYKLTLQTYADAMQRLVSFSCELLKNTPPVNEDGGCLIWGSEPVFCLCLNVGTHSWPRRASPGMPSTSYSLSR